MHVQCSFCLSRHESFQKEFARVKKEFYMPPTPENVAREAQLKSLASIVLIYMEAVLFAQVW